MKCAVVLSFMVMFVLVSAIPAHAEDGAAKIRSKKDLKKTKKPMDQFYPFIVPLSSESFHGLTPSEAAEKELKRTSSGAVSE